MKQIHREYHTGIVPCVIAILLLFSILVFRSSAAERKLTVVAGGESHGMIEACNCEHSPGGGVAKRAALLKELRGAGPLLLVDAGGFSGGGIYDDYTAGRAADSVRTIQMLVAMGRMKYDAVAIGDDDLQYGGTWLVKRAASAKVPLVCANCFRDDGKLLAKPYVIVKRSGLKIGITAVCTDERLFSLDTTVRIERPEKALQKIWKKLCRKTDVQILLSHTGSEISRDLAGKFSECDIVVNGHRKTGADPGNVAGNTAVLEFGFQGKSLSAVNIRTAHDKLSFSEPQWHRITPDLTDDSAIVRLVSAVDTVAARNRYDLYIMSQCPYGLEALREFSGFVALNPSARWNIWFIGTVSSDTVFSSLHGESEIDDEMVWLAVNKLYPDVWPGFCMARSGSKSDTRTIAAKFGVDLKKVDAWISTSGRKELKKHYYRSMRQSIDASPTLLVNNRPFGRKITKTNLLRFDCKRSSATGSTACDDLPECGEDVDCRKPGFHGTCTPEGKCTFEKAVSFTFTTVTADSTMQHPESGARTTTEELFPGAEIVTYTLSSPEGSTLVGRLQPDALPLYLFDSTVANDINFSRIREGLVQKGGYFTFRQGVVPSNYSLNRKKTPGTLVLFCDPFFRGVADILSTVLGDTLYRERITIQPLIFKEPKSAEPGTEEFLRQEEALRWLLLGKKGKEVALTYLQAYGNRPGSSWWTRLLDGCDITPDSLAAEAIENRHVLETFWHMLGTLQAHAPVLLLKDNVEIITISGKREFETMLRECIHQENM